MPRAGLRCGTLQFYPKLETTAFGGPAAHVAMMDKEVVRPSAPMKSPVSGWSAPSPTVIGGDTGKMATRSTISW
jgi:hypothetical protein